MNESLTRRSILKGGAGFVAAATLGPRVDAGGPPTDERPALVVFWLNGGPAGLFNSARSFLANGAFGVTAENVRDLGNGLFVDAGSLGALPPAARAHMASINFRHDVVRPHEKARAAVLESGPRSRLLRLAAALPKGPYRCAIVNDLGLPVGLAADPPAEGGARFERVVEMPSVSPLETLRRDEIRRAYGVPEGATEIRDQRTTFAAVETLVRLGAGVVFAQPAYTGRTDRQFDTHGDESGEKARDVMRPITPSLATFLDRTLGLPGRNVVTLLVGEFSRTFPESDHEPGGTATVIGKRVRTGTAGPQRPDGAPPESAPPPEALWACVAAALGLASAPFGANPNQKLIL